MCLRTLIYTGERLKSLLNREIQIRICPRSLPGVASVSEVTVSVTGASAVMTFSCVVSTLVRVSPEQPQANIAHKKNAIIAVIIAFLFIFIVTIQRSAGI